MIYFLKTDRENSPIKIGYTSRPNTRKRIAELQTGCPYKLSLIGTMRGTLELEKSLHDIFSYWRCDGGQDWYESNFDLLKLATSK